MRLEHRTVSLALRAPVATAHGMVSDRDLVLVTLRGNDGAVGHGEAGPLASYDGVSIPMVHEALAECEPVLADYCGHAPVADVLARCAERVVLPQALAAIDLALWDLAGRRTGEPVWRLLGAAGPAAVAVNWSIAASDRSGAALEAAQARAAGFRTVKVKVGLGDDAGRLAAIRAFAGPQMAIRIDANGAWEPAEAAAMLRAFEPLGLELCEEPVHGLAAISALRGSGGIALALDESAAEPLALSAPPSAELVCLKIARCGGISATLAAAAQARAAGYEVYLASTYDGPLGIAAALHVAAVLRPQRACGLATLSLFAAREEPLSVFDATMSAPTSPGLGAGLADWYGVAL